jgi:hypothetical protein
LPLATVIGRLIICVARITCDRPRPFSSESGNIFALRTVHPTRPPVISLSDQEMTVVMSRARAIDDPEKRSVLLECVAAALLRGDNDRDVYRIVERSLRGLVHAAA